MIRWIGIVLLIAVVVVFVVAFVVTRVENAQHSANQQLQERQATASDKLATTAVVVFSRSGNTGILANHIANKTNANIYEITANNYELGVPGLISALKDARSNVADIMPTRIDLSSYDTVYLGSPIWLYSPAPPIWQFASDNDFTNKHVVLFNTFNSKFEQHFIDEFEALVRSNGAVSFSHQYVKRGRMGSQISTEQMLKIFDQKQ
ncbi:flavodoxin family protein [Vibrio natriegens]|uniref:flavodoxin family protein n=1 Tax=Vibrio natriegens TaxID=691 RepID=UPI001FBB7ABA|nr:flavodoxin [Vibrio natriegens]